MEPTTVDLSGRPHQRSGSPLPTVSPDRVLMC